MQSYLNLLPMPNFTSPENLLVSKGAYNYQFQESLTVPKWLNSARLDYNFTDKTQFYARFNYWYEDQQGNGVSAGNTTWGWLPQHYTAITLSGNLSLTHIFSPTLVFQGQMGYSQFSEAGPPLSDAALTARQRATVGFNYPQLYPASNPYNLVPAATFGVSNSANPAYTSRFPLQGVENVYTWNANLTKILGSHSMKFGVAPEHWLAMKGKNASAFAGSMNFTQDSNNPLDTGYAYSNALLGVLDQYTETNGRFPMYELNTSVEWYAQDTWKVRHNLTVDAGIRWGWATPWHAPHDQEAAFVPSVWNPQQVVKLIQPTTVNGKRMGLDPYTGAILPALTIGAIAPEAPNQLNGIVNRANASYPQGMRESGGIKTGPHLGFSWDPFGKGKTVVRAGGAIFYSFHPVDNFGYGYEFSTPPYQYNPVTYYSYLTQIQQGQNYVAPSAVTGFNAAQPVQQTYSFSFNIQQNVGWNSIVEVAYVGSLGRHLVEAENLNSEPLGTDWKPTSRDATNNNAVLPSQFMRPYQGYGNITNYFEGGNSSYHSLQAQYRRRAYRSSLTYGVIYTYSKTMDYSDTETSAATTQISSLIDPKVWNYGLAGYDHTQIFRIYATYNLPKASSVVHSRVVKQVFDNWQLSGIYTAQSGAPGTVSCSLLSDAGRRRHQHGYRPPQRRRQSQPEHPGRRLRFSIRQPLRRPRIRHAK